MRLIDADALRDALGITGTADSCKGCKYNDRFEFACNTDAAPTFEYVCEMIDDAPTIEERKTGKWVKVHGYCTPGGDPVWCCSECGKGVHVYGIEHGTYGADISDGQWKACPNCSALMEGEQP